MGLWLLLLLPLLLLLLVLFAPTMVLAYTEAGAIVAEGMIAVVSRGMRTGVHGEDCEASW